MELNRERIIRGLACCKGSYDCFTCDIYKRGCAGFRDGLAKDALSLINELTEENERLRETSERTVIAANMAGVPFPEGLEIVYNYCESRVKKAEADTVRKIADLIWKGQNINRVISIGDKFLDKQEFIDQIAKEMEEESGYE